jgi:Uma2 family endonuclease
MATLALTSPEDGVYLTAEEYFRLPPGPPFYQLVDGQLYMSPAPDYWKHNRIQDNLSHELHAHVKAHRLGRVATAPTDLKVDSRNVVQPDLFFVAREKLKGGESFFDVVPDLVVEILSPGNAKLDLTRKRRLYESCGVNEIWFVDPRKETIEILRRAGDSYTSHTAQRGESVESPLFPGLTLRLEAVFGDYL